MDYSKEGIRKVLQKRNEGVITQITDLKDQSSRGMIVDTTYKRLAIGVKGHKKATFAIVKADAKAKYKNVIDVLDELQVADVGKYALVDMSPAEIELIKVYKGNGKKNVHIRLAEFILPRTKRCGI